MKYITTNNKTKKNNKICLILTIITLITIILSLFLYLYIIPICILNIIISYLLRKKSKLYYLNIILNIICIILAILLFIFREKPLNNLVGTWYCKYYDSDNYIVELNANSNNLFIWSKYNDKLNNNIKGNYKLKKLDKTDNNKNVYYYNLILDSNKKEKYHQEYDIAINKKEEKKILVNREKMKFICDKINSENQVIKE